MRLVEFQEFHIYTAKVRTKNFTYRTSVDVTVYAKSPAMATQLLRDQYGTDATISNVRKIG